MQGAYWNSVSYDLNSVLDGETSIFNRNSVSKDQWKTTHWISGCQFYFALKEIQLDFRFCSQS